MTHSRFFREDFDREREFIARRAFLAGGKGYVPGQKLDKTQFSVRRLRQLYDQRYLEMVQPVRVVNGYPVGLPKHDSPSVQENPTPPSEQTAPAEAPQTKPVMRRRPVTKPEPVKRRKLSV